MGVLSGWPLFLQRLITTLGFQLLRFILMTIQKVYWNINGTSDRIRESRRPENYNRCAHVLDIVLFYKFEHGYTISIRDYILTHNRFDSPQYIFDNDHVSLMTMNEENAIFCVAKQKGMHLWKLEYHSFMRVAQMLHCNQLILVPLNHFHRMAEELGDPKGQLIFLFNTGRCGSTLLSQMMQTTGKCISISEPETLNDLALYCKRKGDSSQLRQLTQDVVRWTCRPFRNITPLAYMLKIKAIYSYGFPVFREVYPDSKCLFMYRDVVKVAQSYYRISRALSKIGRTRMLRVLFESLPDKCYDHVGISEVALRHAIPDGLSQGFTFATFNCKQYLEFRRNGLEVSAVRYEDIINDKHFAARAVLEFCGLPLSLEQAFLQGLESDSQGNSAFSQKQTAKYTKFPLTPEFERLANEILKKNGLPRIGDDWLLEGTITCRG